MVPPDGVPAYESIKKYVRKLIEKGELSEGDSLPSEYNLATKFQVSRSLARQALRELEIEGFIERSQGKRSRVAPVENRLKPISLQSVPIVALAFLGVQSKFSQRVLWGFTNRASELGYQTLTYNVWLNNDAEFEFLRSLHQCGVSGMAVWLHDDKPSTRELLEDFLEKGFPFVQIDRFVRELPSDIVVTDNVDVGYQLTKTLLKRLHRRIAVCIEPDPVSSVQDRLNGYQNALKEAHIDFDTHLVFTLNSEDEERSINILHSILALRESPTAFFCINEYLMSLLIDELTTLGYHIPSDFELAVVDDSDAAKRLGIPIIRAIQQAEQMGKRSAELLVNRISHPLKPVEQEFLKAEVVSDILPDRAPGLAIK